MENSAFSVQPIGIIHSPFQDLEGIPIQPGASKGARGKIILAPEYTPGLKDLDGFSHVILVYYFHQAEGYQLQIKPFLDETKRGLFATRAPKRPNPLGISIVRLVSVSENIVEVEDLDILDGTPLLDIKPYVPDFDSAGEIRLGWLEERRDQISGKLADDRFS